MQISNIEFLFFSSEAMTSTNTANTLDCFVMVTLEDLSFVLNNFKDLFVPISIMF